jgi:DNA-directed RNA polymerase subunit RPC12/RpoP
MNKNKRRCPNCSSVEMTRVQRRGFMQERVYPKLGLYPWECPFCREVHLLKSRGRGYRRINRDAEGTP